MELTGLTESVSHTYRAYSDAACAAALTTVATDAEFRTLTPTQVSNLGQTAHANTQTIHSVDRAANAFTTGGTASDSFAPYRVVVDFVQKADNATVSLYTNGSNNRPGTLIGALERQGSSTSGEVAYTASGIVLNGNTTYWLVFETSIAQSDSANIPTVRATASDDEDDGSSSEWSIANAGYSGFGAHLDRA